MTLDAPSSSSPEDTTDEVAARVHSELDDRPWMRRVAQVGWVAKAVVYASLGWAAIEIAMRSPAADKVEYTGIVTVLADGTFTRLLLGLIAVGLVFYIAFRLVSIALIDDDDLDAWAHRVGYLGSVVTYVTVAWAAMLAALRGPRPDSGSTVERVSRALLENAWGRVGLALGGLVALGVAGYFFYKGATRRFLSQIDLRDASSFEHRVIEVSGAIGWIGRGAVVAAAAGFITWSAIDADPTDVRGLDRSLDRIANEQLWGRSIVLGVAVALLLYAFFCAVSARRRRLAWDDNPEPGCEPAEPTIDTKEENTP